MEPFNCMSFNIYFKVKEIWKIACTWRGAIFWLVQQKAVISALYSVIFFAPHKRQYHVTHSVIHHCIAPCIDKTHPLNKPSITRRDVVRYKCIRKRLNRQYTGNKAQKAENVANKTLKFYNFTLKDQLKVQAKELIDLFNLFNILVWKLINQQGFFSATTIFLYARPQKWPGL